MMPQNQSRVSSCLEKGATSVHAEPDQYVVRANVHQNTGVFLLACLTALLLMAGCQSETDRADRATESQSAQVDAGEDTTTSTHVEESTSTHVEETVITIDTTQQTRLSGVEADSLLARPSAVSVCSRLDSLWVSNALGEEEAQSSPTVIHVVSGAYQFDIVPHRLIGGGMVDDRSYRKFAVDGMIGLHYDKGLFKKEGCGLLSMTLYGPNWTDFIVYGDGGNAPRQAQTAEGMLSLHLVDSTIVMDLRSKAGRITYKSSGLSRVHTDSLAEPIHLPEPLNGTEILNATQQLPRLSRYQCDQVKVYTDGTMLRKNFRSEIYPNVVECINFIEKALQSNTPASFETKQVGVRKKDNIEFSYHYSMTG